MPRNRNNLFNLPPTEGNICILPYGPHDVAPETLAALRNPELNSTQHQKFEDTPPFVFLDNPSNCSTNSQNIALATRTLLGSKTGFSALLVGMKGFNGFYLPQKLSSLTHQARLAATAAKQMGRLGQGHIKMVLKRSVRPAPVSDWHQDIGNTFLLAASKVSCVLALKGAQYTDKLQAAFNDESQLYSPLAGMPIAMGRILHTGPYEVAPYQLDEDTPSPVSSMVVFYEISGNRPLHQEQVNAHPLHKAIMRTSGVAPKRWNYA